MTLYTRIFASFWAVMLLIVSGAVGITWVVLAERVEEMPRASAELVESAARALRDGGERGLVEWLRAPDSRRRGLAVLVVDGEGRELLGRPLPPWLARAARREVANLPGITILPARPTLQLVAPDGRSYGLVVLPPRREFGPLGLPETRHAVLLLALLATGIASWLLARSVTRPLRSLGAATRELARGNLDVQVEPGVSGRRDELGTLGRDFDSMASRLRELIKGREQLLRDVSHELRSPLARMRVATGLARQAGSDVLRQLERIEVEIERLDRLIGQVLNLARLDAEAGPALEEQVDLVDLVDGIARDASFEAQARGVTIEWAVPATAHTVRGRGPLLSSAVENVVRNALTYAAPGTSVTLLLESLADAERIVVRDRGPGVPEAELARIFEPFYRVAESRSREAGGDGIGLAIAARVLAAHGGETHAANRDGGGLEVTLTLPRRAATAAGVRY